ncbi:MAG TPA: hypothetical protein PLT66_02325 [Bacillota bacterium]|nr:hypothetical protein [Bacillota bacterium]
MKRRMVFILLFIMIFCVSCSKDNAPDTDYSYTDNYIYANLNSTFYRFNVENGTASPLCPDPLCEHNDESCPFFGMEGDPVFTGQYVYYLAGASDFGEAIRLCRFDLRSGKYENLYEPAAGTLSEMNVYGNNVYLNQNRLTENGSVEFLLMKYDLKNKKATALTEKAQSVPQYFLSTENGRIYWYTSGGEHYSTDMEYKNRIDGDTGYADRLSSGNYAYIVEPTGEIKGVPGSKLPAFRLRRKDKTTGDTITVIAEMCSFPTIYNNCILYFKFQDSVPFIGCMYDEYSGERVAVTDKNGGKLYICDSDGKNERLLCDIGDSGCAFTNATGVTGKSGSGDYIGIELSTYYQDGEYIKLGESALLLVNIKTGEYKIVRTD